MINPYETPKCREVHGEIAGPASPGQTRKLFYCHLALVAFYTIVVRYFVTAKAPMDSSQWPPAVLLLTVVASWFVFPLVMVWLTSKEKLSEQQRVTFVMADILLVAFHVATLLPMLNHH